MPKKLKPIAIGEKYGMLTILEEVEPKFNKKGAMNRQVSCICECGNNYIGTFAAIKDGNTKSCGCFHKEIMKKTFTTHGKCTTPEYRIWYGIIARCTIVSHEYYNDYGGRGITVCDRWKESLENFIEDMGIRPGKEYSIDRINNDLGYSKENCRWATMKEQANNKRTNVIIDFNGLSMNVTQWSEYTGIRPYNISLRISRGWSIEKTLTTPSHKKLSHTDRCNNIIEYNGEKKTIKEWSKYAEVSVTVFYARIKYGWPIEKALKNKKLQ